MKTRTLLLTCAALLSATSSMAQWGFSENASLPIPTALPATDVSEYGYQANWEEMSGVEGYTVFTYLTRRAKEDGQKIYLFHSDFDWIDSNGTLDNPDDNGTTSNGFVTGNFNDINRYGWQTAQAIYANGVFGFNNCWNGTGYLYGQIMSPTFDMSLGDGKVYVDLTVCGQEGADSISVKLYDGSTFPNTLLDEQHIDVTTEWQTYNLEFDDAYEDCYIHIGGQDKGDGVHPIYYFFDEIGIYQNCYKGEEVQIPYVFTHRTLPTYTSAYVDTDSEEDGVYAYTVSCYAEGWMSIQSDMIYTQDVENSIKSNQANMASVAMNNGLLSVSNPEGKPVSVYNAAGQLVYSNSNGSTTIATPICDRGIYIVKVGNQSYKIMQNR